MSKSIAALLALPFAFIMGVVLLVTGGALAQSTNVAAPALTSVTAGATATMAAIGLNPSRKQLTICNEHASNTVTFTTGTTTPVSLTTGRVLAAGNLVTSCMTLGAASSKEGVNVGNQINIIASSVSTPVTFIEYF